MFTVHILQACFIAYLPCLEIHIANIPVSYMKTWEILRGKTFSKPYCCTLYPLLCTNGIITYPVGGLSLGLVASPEKLLGLALPCLL